MNGRVLWKGNPKPGELMPELRPLLARRVRALSGGEQQILDPPRANASREPARAQRGGACLCWS
jgi:hypothetical protein